MLLWCVRFAWLSCALGVGAMLPALVLRSSDLVSVFEMAIVVTFSALTCAVLSFAWLVVAPDDATKSLCDSGSGSLGRRMDILFAAVLADLLDPE